MSEVKKRRIGFALLTKRELEEVSRKGGLAVHESKNPPRKWTREEAIEWGLIGIRRAHEKGTAYRPTSEKARQMALASAEARRRKRDLKAETGGSK